MNKTVLFLCLLFVITLVSCNQDYNNDLKEINVSKEIVEYLNDKIQNDSLALLNNYSVRAYYFDYKYVIGIENGRRIEIPAVLGVVPNNLILRGKRIDLINIVFFSKGVKTPGKVYLNENRITMNLPFESLISWQTALDNPNSYLVVDDYSNYIELYIKTHKIHSIQ